MPFLFVDLKCIQNVRCLKANGKGYSPEERDNILKQYSLPSALADGHEEKYLIFEQFT